MGCCSARPALPPDAPEEERTFAAKEMELGYSKNPATLVLASIKKNSDAGKISPSKFNTIALELGLNTTDYDSPDTPMCTFYGKFKEKSKYDFVKLGVLGVLLGRGVGKAALFFSCVAKEDGSPLESAEVRAFFEALFFVSAEALPLLAKVGDDETPTPGSMPASTLTAYISTLKSGKDNLAERYTNAVMKGRGKVTLQDFVTTFEGDENLSALTTPYGVRTALKKEAPPAAPAGGAKAVMAMFGKGLLGGLKK